MSDVKERIREVLEYGPDYVDLFEPESTERAYRSLLRDALAEIERLEGALKETETELAFALYTQDQPGASQRIRNMAENAVIRIRALSDSTVDEDTTLSGGEG